MIKHERWRQVAYVLLVRNSSSLVVDCETGHFPCCTKNGFLCCQAGIANSGQPSIRTTSNFHHGRERPWADLLCVWV